MKVARYQLCFLVASLAANQLSAQEPSPARVTLSLEEFEALYSTARLQESQSRLEKQRQRQDKEHEQKMKELEQTDLAFFPENFQVLEHNARGSVDGASDMATFDMEITIRVMQNNQWTKIPLVANRTVASGWKIDFLQNNDGATLASLDAITDPDVLLLRKDDHVQLAARKSGLYRLRFQTFSRVVKTRNVHQLVMSQFLYPLSDFGLNVSGRVRDFSVEPVEAFWTVVSQISQDGNVTSSNVQVTLPLTADKVEVRWLDDTAAGEPKTSNGSEKERDDAQPGQEETPQLTVVHEVLHSVDEGVVRSSHILEFASTGELSVPIDLTLIAGPETRISGIESHAIQSWEVHKTTKEEQKVRLNWKRSHLESTASVLLQTETGRAGAKEEQVTLPTIVCQDVLRQVGHVGITKDANVEVHEHATFGGMARCEASEVSSKLRLNMNRPIVLSYKYLNPQNASVILDVQEHQAMETLEASVDRLHYKAVVTETHAMHSVLVVLQSTKLQYLEVFGLPETASMYTLMVNSVPSKPVEGKNHSILVPLLVGLDAEAANTGQNLHTSVELSYISTHESPMTHNGTLWLSPPHFELPISVFTTHYRLPKEYEYEFSGDFGDPDDDLAVPIPPSYSYQTGKRVVELDYQFGFKDDVWPDDDVKPKESAVKISMPSVGRSFHFHRLLVLGTKLSMSAFYSEPIPEEPPLPWWSISKWAGMAKRVVKRIL